MVILVIVLLIITVWVVLFLEHYDAGIPTRALPPYRRVLVVFPHPDDESLSCGGTVYNFAAKGSRVDLLVLTKGERGVEGAALTPELKPLRTAELLNSASYLNVTGLLHYDLGDNELDHKEPRLTGIINAALARYNPDLVITYDRSGLYGHPDHIVVSDVVTRAIKERFRRTALWYISRPSKAYRRLNLPTHMAKNPEFVKQRKFPSFKVYVSPFGVTAKIMSLESHRSQHFAFKKNLRILPIWFWVSTQLFEYYHVAHKGK